ncbi:uncharacterized protein [Drosophila kikkawai]|uniref:Uncharacterized protein n=1 Tax=Drosophila kikkawai TaxID=30033 RepID=A0A6P4IAV6_DROKI|nr:uncharacterized protein LOC108072876 [Drosophila kikkawai]
MLAATKAVTFILAALIAAMILPLPSSAAFTNEPELDQDRPNTNFTALFKAFLDMGNAIFGDWAPERVIEDFIRESER